MKPHVLWSIGEVVGGPRSQLLQSTPASFSPVQAECYWKHWRSQTTWLLLKGLSQQIDSILHSDTMPVGNMQGVKCWLHQRVKVVQDEPLHGLHQVGSQCYQSVKIELPGASIFWHWNHTGSVLQFRNSLQTQDQVEDMQDHMTEEKSKISWYIFKQ